MLRSRVVIACVLALGVTACDAGRRNPPGTEASRAADRVAGTNISGAYPMQSDGMPGNPPGTAAGRAANELLGTTATR